MTYSNIFSKRKTIRVKGLKSANKKCNFQNQNSHIWEKKNQILKSGQRNPGLRYWSKIVIFEFLGTFLTRSIGYFVQSCFIFWENAVFKNMAQGCSTPLKLKLLIGKCIWHYFLSNLTKNCCKKLYRLFYPGYLDGTVFSHCTNF